MFQRTLKIALLLNFLLPAIALAYVDQDPTIDGDSGGDPGGGPCSGMPLGAVSLYLPESDYWVIDGWRDVPLDDTCDFYCSVFMACSYQDNGLGWRGPWICPRDEWPRARGPYDDAVPPEFCREEPCWDVCEPFRELDMLVVTEGPYILYGPCLPEGQRIVRHPWQVCMAWDCLQVLAADDLPNSAPEIDTPHADGETIKKGAEWYSVMGRSVDIPRSSGIYLKVYRGEVFKVLFMNGEIITETRMLEVQ